MEDTILKVRALFKAQSALTRIELRAKATQAVYVSVALVFGLLALGMINVGAFLGLSTYVGGTWAALILGVFDAILAAVVAKLAAGVTIGREGETATQLRDIVVESLTADAERLKNQFQGVQQDFGRVQNAISTVTHGASGISHIVGLLSSALKKKTS